MRSMILNLLLVAGLLVAAPATMAQEMTEADTPADEPPPPAPVMDLGPANIDPAIPCTVTMADGTKHKGNLTHVLVARDWYGNDPELNTGFTIAVDINLLNLDWSNVRRVTVSPPNTSSDMDCYSDEDQDPILWECTLKQVAAVQMREKHQHSGTYRVDTRETFTFVFDNDPSTKVSFQLYKLVANTQHYDSMSQALQDLQGALKEKNRQAVRRIDFE
jgi:hypothetical protein